MKKSQATFKIFLALAAALTLAGCKKHKPPLPPQSQPPAVIEQPPPQPLTPEPAVNPPEEPTTNPKPPTPTPKPPPVRHTRVPKKPANGNEKPGSEIAKATPPKIVIQETPQPNSQNATAAAPLTAHDEAAHNAASMAQLNESTEANVNGVKRSLSPREQTMLSQIRDYLSQSAQAAKDGDVMRARNLALKAHLLSDELAKPR